MEAELRRDGFVVVDWKEDAQGIICFSTIPKHHRHHQPQSQQVMMWPCAAIVTVSLDGAGENFTATGYHGIIYANQFVQFYCESLVRGQACTFHFATFMLEQADKTLRSDDYNAISVGYPRYDKCFASLVRDWTMIKCDDASLERCLCPSENEITSHLD
ncbi:hypothetical protein RHSIM_Rhsim02G0018400 [Rhododendron simsii]|uniref:Uncharacterized protein n=1 Tax=Rhododendron simsii TaxID=118357 RepID=A0A834HGD9_RHOSS|nr:hypothetical protein RHSIM_Rhsim02G0018400 [Rhododendron simsii]